MNLISFRKDIDELIDEFTQGGSTTFAEMKRVWLSKKFTYIYEASPSTNLGFFMQSLYAHSIGTCLTLETLFCSYAGYMVGNASLSHRLGGLYCLYCLHETQPFKPPFRVYLSLGELRKLRLLVADAKAENIRVVPTLVKRMLERKMFLFGSVDLVEGSVTDTVNQLQQLQNARIQVAYEKLFDSTSIENYIHMDLGMEVDLNLLKKMSSEYAEAKNVAIKEASNVIDVQNIQRISEDKELLGNVVEKIADDWNAQKETFYKQTGVGDDEGYGQVLEQLLLQDDD
ncbi:small nuclear RNA activating complex (SNAPc), subunit SNAP43 [Senna tora]|uniref:Small nuclear RNA activating complex (SNAPc), subunit SNAP43 n=1 Tax=Senna tora TaxID=362788 RepID=A0A834WX28_9FABA|nr:small nuclear RNA activating complex (SNAPc), subunit SNAP43 [Senna tora]